MTTSRILAVFVSAILALSLACNNDPADDPMSDAGSAGTTGTGGTTATGGTSGTGGTTSTGGTSGTSGSSGSSGQAGTAGNAGSSGSSGSSGDAGTPDADANIPITIEPLTWGDHHRIAIPGETDVISATYRVRGATATNPFTETTVGNMPKGIESDIEPTLALDHVWASCSSPTGVGDDTFYDAAVDDQGHYFFGGMNCWDETGDGFIFTVYYEVNTLVEAGPILFGQRFRLVLEDSRITDNQGGVLTRVVRNSYPTYEMHTLDPALKNGENEVRLSIASHPHGDTGHTRVVVAFDTSDVSGGNALTLGNFEIDNTTGSVYISDYLGTDLGQDNLEGNLAFFVFQQLEVVPAGNKLVYPIRFSASNVDSGDSVVVYIVDTDEDHAVTGMTAEGNPNTARVCSPDPTAGLFASQAELLNGILMEDRNAVWTDRPSSANYDGVTCVSESVFTNGWGLRIQGIPPVILLMAP